MTAMDFRCRAVRFHRGWRLGCSSFTPPSSSLVCVAILRESHTTDERPDVAEDMGSRHWLKHREDGREEVAMPLPPPKCNTSFGFCATIRVTGFSNMKAVSKHLQQH